MSKSWVNPSTAQITAYKKWQSDLNRRKLYKISSAQYEVLIDSHGGSCWLCGDKPPQLCVDHDHETGKIRGMLCRGCNVSLGHYEKLAKNPRVKLYLQGKTLPKSGS